MLKNILLLKINPLVELKTPHPYTFRFPYMLKYIEALLARDNKWNIKLIDCQIMSLSFDALIRETAEFSPDVIVVYSITPAYSRVIDYARKIKKISRNVTIIKIGQDISFCPERYLYSDSPVDIGIMGEAESGTHAVIDKLNAGYSIKEVKENFCSSDPKIILDLDTLPFPIYDNYSVRYSYVYPVNLAWRLRWGHILSSRGCPYKCIFCSQTIRESYGDAIRKRTPENIADEIEFLLSKGVNIIGFDDDDFTADKKHVHGVCREIMQRKIKVPWLAHARIDNVDRDLLYTMRESGCTLLRFGIESASGRILDILRKTNLSDWAEKSVEIFGYCRKINLDTAALFLIGNPTETKEEIMESIELTRRLRPSIIQVSFFTPYPGSAAYKIYEKELAKMDVSEMYHYNKPIINVSSLDTQTLEKMLKLFYGQFLLNPVFIVTHFIKYAFFYMLNPDIFLRLIRIKNYLIERDKNYDSA